MPIEGDAVRSAPCRLRLVAFWIDFSTSLGACCAPPAPRDAITVQLRRNNANFGTFTRRPMHWRKRRQLPRQRYVNAFNTSLKSYFAETTARLDGMMMLAKLSTCGVYATQSTNRMNGRQDSVSWLFYCWFFATKRVCQLKVILYSVYISYLYTAIIGDLCGTVCRGFYYQFYC